MDLSIIIPVYNEQEILEANISETLRFFSTQPLAWELIVVNDGSTDSTGKILKIMQERDARVQVITFQKNRGKGAAVREGFQHCAGDSMLFFDIDLSTPLSEFPKFWAQKKEQSVLVASRSLPSSIISTHQAVCKEWAGRCGDLLTRLLLPLTQRDTQCGFKLYPASFRNLLSLSQMNGAGFDIEWLLIAFRNGFTIEELPVTWTNRPSSHFGPLAYLRTLREVAAIFTRDMRGAYRGELP